MAIPSAADFLAEFPEFGSASTPSVVTVVNAKIAEAAEHIDETVWGPAYARGIKTLTAVLLASTPAGRPMRIEKTDKTVYDRQFRALQRRVVNAFRTGGRT